MGSLSIYRNLQGAKNIREFFSTIFGLFLEIDIPYIQVHGCFLNPNHYGAVMAMIMPICLVFLMKGFEERKWPLVGLWTFLFLSSSRPSELHSIARCLLHKVQDHCQQVHSFLVCPPSRVDPVVGLSLPSFGSSIPSSTA